MNLIKFFPFILLIFFPLGQLGRFPTPFPGVVIQLNDLVVGILVGIWFLWRVFGKQSFSRPPLTKPIAAFILVALFSLLINWDNFAKREILMGGFYLIRWALYGAVYFLVFDILKTVKKQKNYQRFLILGMMVTGVTVTIFGFIQYFLYPNLRNLVYLGWDPHHFRLFGTFFDPNFAGIILVLTALLILSHLISDPNYLKKKWLWAAGFLVFLALILTYSRSSYLALLVGVLTMAIFKRNRLILGIFSILALILIFFSLARVIFYAPTLPERAASTQARLSSWGQSLTIIRNHPLFGVGFNTYRFVQSRYGFLGKDDWEVTHAGGGTDSSLLFLWATTGVVGLVVYLWMWWRIVQLPINLVLLASTVALFTHSLFVNSLFYPWVMEWLWILVGLTQVEIKDYK